MPKKYHKFNPVTDTCERCGVKRRRVNHVGNGFNPTLRSMFHYEYSDGEKWVDEFINCKKEL